MERVAAAAASEASDASDASEASELKIDDGWKWSSSVMAVMGDGGDG